MSEFITYCTLKGIIEDTGSSEQNGKKGVMYRYKVAHGDYYAILVVQDDNILTSCLYKAKDNGGWDEWPQPCLGHLVKVFC